ncbi:MAG: septal ring lytic transglycosylase RlpA family protein [Bacteroidales bacterium]|nr:septal ring lytic transglycosylase RlpA family protein [Bacteroidales bacterium]
MLSLCAENVSAGASLKTGTASFYNKKFNGRKTSSGERVDNDRFTAAHPSIPFGTLVRVTNLANGKSVVVKVNDRFYPKKGHLIDITYAAAVVIDMVRQGMARVTLEVLDISESEAEVESMIPADTVTFKIPAGNMTFPVEKPKYKRMMDIKPEYGY